jgi:prepilin-type N-terminal cleavage/methylation domain-containing protein
MDNRFLVKNRGFTLVELLIAISIFIAVSLIGADYVINSFKTINQDFQQSEGIKTLRRSMEIMINEIRGANSSERGDYALAKINPSEIIFYNDVSGDDKRESVRYYLSDNDLIREIIFADAQNEYNALPVISVLAHNISSEDIFTYYDQNGQLTSLINNVSLVKINLSLLTVDSRSGLNRTLSLESSVSLRNLKIN